MRDKSTRMPPNFRQPAAGSPVARSPAARNQGKRPGTITESAAEALGLQALVFIVEDEGRLSRFLAETGMAPEALRSQAGAPATLAAVLGHLLDDESLMLVFTSGASVDPVDMQSAYRRLGGAPIWDSV